MDKEQSRKIRTRVPKSTLCENWHWCQFWHWILALVPILALDFGVGANFGIRFWQHWILALVLILAHFQLHVRNPLSPPLLTF